MKSVPSPHLRC